MAEHETHQFAPIKDEVVDVETVDEKAQSVTESQFEKGMSQLKTML
jgi:hypothetical protein